MCGRFHSVARPGRASSAFEDKEGIMNFWDNLPVGAALVLASAAALTSGSAEARREVAGFVAGALLPQVADTGYFSDPADGLVWPLPPADGRDEDRD
jgi:hypothetical protein